MKNKRIASLFFLILTTILLTACGAAPATSTPAVVVPADEVVAEGHITPNADVQLTFAVGGQVAEILVHEGQQVAKGDVLIRLGNQDAAKAELLVDQQAYDLYMRTINQSSAQAWGAYQKATAARERAQLDWEKVNVNSILDQIDTTDDKLHDKQTAIDDAKDALSFDVNLRPDNPIRRQDEANLRRAEADYNTIVRQIEDLRRQIDGPRAALDAAVAAEAEAQRTYDLSKDGPDPEQKDLMAARLAAAQDAFDNFELRAPFAGVVTDVNATVGELAGPGKYAIQMADLSQWFVETSDLTELEVVKVKQGQAVQIAPDALPGITLPGRVVSISQSSKVQGGDVLYTVKIKLDGTNPQLRWGMTVQCTFNP
jgi:multidrug resistance efflux pump